VGYALNNTDDEWHSFMEIQNRFDDYTNLARFNVYVKTGSNLTGGNTVQLGFYAYSLTGTNLANAQLNFVREAEGSSKSWLYCDAPIKHVIPFWYGTNNSPITKLPAFTTWNNAENCPGANIWVWRDTTPEPDEYWLYVRDVYANILKTKLTLV
jgi:hypothetical protein